MKIRMNNHTIWFGRENGYVMKAAGEMLSGYRYGVYTASMKSWEPPHEQEPVTPEDIREIIREAKKKTEGRAIRLVFDSDLRREGKKA